LNRVWEVLHPYPEVLEGRVTEDSFVVTVGGIWERLELGWKVEVDPRYLDPEGFYSRTHFTEAMKSLIRNIVRRLNGEVGVQSIYHLRVGMGGGKSHTLLLLYYFVRCRERVASLLRAEDIVDAVPKARVAVLDGMRIQPLFGVRYPDGSHVYTPWGLLLKQLGVYEAYRELDNWREVPTVPVLREALSQAPTLILVDELTYFMDMVMGDESQSNRVQQFLQALTAAISETRGCALVVATPIGVYDEAARLLAKILDRYSRPMIIASGGEYKQIRKRAIFQDGLQVIEGEGSAVSAEYSSYYATHLKGYARQAEEAILENYPFHPFVDRTLLKLKSNKAFQEVRDELRFLAGLVYSVYKARYQDAYLINVSHAELTDQYVRAGTIAKLQNPILVSRLDNDLARIKDTLEPELHEAARRILATITLNSLSAETPLQLGVTDEEIIYATLTPDLSPEVLRKALNECGRNLWFVNLMDGRWVFGSPNLNKLVDDYRHKVERDRSLRGSWWDIITKELNDWRASAHKAYVKDARDRKAQPLFEEGNIYIWPGRSEEIPDHRQAKLVLLDYHLPLSSVIPAELLSEDEMAMSIATRVASSGEEAAQVAKEFHESYGRESRKFKNTVFFLVAERTLVEKDGPVRYAKQLLALEEMLRDQAQLKTLIGESGIKSIEQMRETVIRDLLPSCIMVYRYLLYPSREGLTAIELGEERRNYTGLLTMIETMLKAQAQKVVESIDADSLLTRYWPQGKAKPTVLEVVEGFYKRRELELPSEPRLVEEAIYRALREGRLLYAYGPDYYYRGREPSRLEDNGILIKDFEIISITFEAVDEQNAPMNINLILDEKLVRRTPFAYEDLKNSNHMVVVEVPEGVEFLGWSDGIQETKRGLTWDSQRTLRLLLRRPPPPPEVYVTLRMEAVDTSKNQPLNVNFWLDDLPYRTPYQEKVKKDSRHKLRVERPPGLIFLGWSDSVNTLERELTCDIDTVLAAKFKPATGVEFQEGEVELSEAHDLFKSMGDREVTSLRLEISMDYPSFVKCSGPITTLLKGAYEATLKGIGSKMGLKQLTLEVTGGGDKVGVMKSSIIQLKDYIETVTIILSTRSAEYKPMQEAVSTESLEALRTAKGTLKYQAQLRSVAIREDHPRRTVEPLLEALKKGA
jgi:hypothetical protein